MPSRRALLALALSVWALASCKRPPSERPVPEVLGQLPEWSLTDQDGRPFGARELRGRVWAANFFFTSCLTACPRIMRRMETVQARLGAPSERVRLVSFSVDPEVDTPARLRAYGPRYHRDPRRWTLVTGSLAALERVIVQGFHVAMGQPVGARGTALFDLTHGNHTVLVDGRGRLRGYYRPDDEGTENLLRDVERLVSEGPARELQGRAAGDQAGGEGAGGGEGGSSGGVSSSAAPAGGT